MRVVILGLPPTTNNLYTIVAGRQIISETGRLYHQSVAAVLRRVWRQTPGAGPFAVLLTYYLNYDRDIDGSQKVVLDGFAPKTKDGERETIVWHDDRQLVLFAARKVKVPKGVLPYIAIIIRPLARPPIFKPITSRAPRILSFSTELIPPTTNNLYTPATIGRRKTRNGKLITQAYREGFAALVRQKDLGGEKFPLNGAVRVKLRFSFTADRRDVDGSSKLIFDAARQILWADDNQVTSYSVAKARVGQKNELPCLEGDIWAL